MRPTRWQRSTHLGIAASVLVLVATVVAAASLWTSGGHDAGAAKIPPPVTTVSPEMVPVPDTAAMPSAGGLIAALTAVLADPDLGELGGRITDAITGTPLWAQRDNLPLQPASTNKLLTAAAALLTLDRQARVGTRVTTGSQPGVIVLVGGGDPTLSAAPADEDTWYRGAARIHDLADQVRTGGVVPTMIQVDISAFEGESMAPGWDALDIEGGDIAPIEAVMLDAGRIQPTTVESRRSPTPALDAGRALARELGVDPGQVTIGADLTTGRELASVQSAPLITRLTEMMDFSDNVLAECIGREVAAAMYRPRSFAGAVDAITNRLATAHIDVTGARLLDSSGLSVDNRLTAKTLDAVVQAATGPDQPVLRSILDLLPVAGGSGTLSDRFVDGDTDGHAAGFLRAKTGSLTHTNALAGVVTDRSWRVLTFAFISNEAGMTGRRAIDAVAATLRNCGC